MPSSAWPFLDQPGPLAIAHRGGAGDAPENTLPAFEAAVRLGFRYLETDVHVTADGVLVAFHDDHLDRVTDRSGAIADLPWDTVKQARVDGREPIPLLADILDAWPDVRVNIDPKHDGCVDALVEVVERTASIDRVCLGSFSDRRLAELRGRLGPRLCTSLGPRGLARLRAASFRLPAVSFPAACAQVPVQVRGRTLVDERFVDAAHRLGLQVHVWTVDEPAEMTRLLDLGIDGIMTDLPATLRRVLTDRGAWHPRGG